MPVVTRGQLARLAEPPGPSVSELYESGVRLWRKEDFVEIEKQLDRWRKARNFTVRCIDGRVVRSKNPMFRKKQPEW